MAVKIACLGAAPSSRKLAPFGDPEWSIWACSPPNYDLPRVDAWFELHSLARKMSKDNAPYFDVLSKHDRVYMNGADPLIGQFPNAIAYPLEDMLKEFGPWFFTSSLAYMLALAIMQKPQMIGLWGVDMSATEEYRSQRAGCHFFIREAAKRGIGVTAPPESDILNPYPLYAYQEQSPLWWKRRARKKEIQQRIAECDHAIQQKQNELWVLRGAVDNMQYEENTYCPSRYNTGV